jgi:hypothetical protein
MLKYEDKVRDIVMKSITDMYVIATVLLDRKSMSKTMFDNVIYNLIRESIRLQAELVKIRDEFEKDYAKWLSEKRIKRRKV